MVRYYPKDQFDYAATTIYGESKVKPKLFGKQAEL
jgi:hypothetical protein